MQEAEQKPEVKRTWLTIDEAAEELIVSKPTVKNYLRGGFLKGYQLRKGGKWRIERTDLDEFKKGKTNQNQ